MANQHYYGVTVKDYSNEDSSTRVSFGAVTAVSIAGLLTQIGDLRTALGNIILGTIARDRWVGDSTTISNVAPATPTAQIELKFQFTYEGDTSKKVYRIEVPTADPSKTVAGTDQVNMADADIAAFVTAFEAIGRTPDDDTETVTVLEGRLVGRNV
ncbi:MAG: hypothetical protein IT564_11610 [Rhodospirillales bacterium]|nr:hypothetical protein [Rhodospirillales bacterium]